MGQHLALNPFHGVCDGDAPIRRAVGQQFDDPEPESGLLDLERELDRLLRLVDFFHAVKASPDHIRSTVERGEHLGHADRGSGHLDVAS